MTDIRNIARNREITWLSFNERVLKEACDDIPVLEKLKFISIFMSNLEEFYMVRVGSLRDRDRFEPNALDNKTGWSPRRQLHEIYLETRRLLKEKDRIHLEVEREMEAKGVDELRIKDLTKDEYDQLRVYYERMILPVLAPQVVDPSHPFPFLNNNEFYVAMTVKKKKKVKLAFVHVPKSIPPVYFLEQGDRLRYIRKELIVKEFAPKLFENFKVSDPVVINITRNADLTPEEEADLGDEDFRKVMLKILKKRKRLQPVRLISDEELPPKMEEMLLGKLELGKDQCFVMKTAVKMGYVFDLKDYLNDPAPLLYEPFKPVRSDEFDDDRSYIDQVLEEDKLLIYPYDDIGQFIDLLDEAGSDDRVLSIKITIYRLSKHSKIVSKLIRAAENGKDVTVLMELRARFDEQNNIDYSEELSEAGCRIIYGIPYYKVHSKVCLITLRENNQIKYLTQFGTGNYNENTSKQYTDLSYMTGKKYLGEDATLFFRNMGIGNLDGEYKHLATSPNLFKPTMMKLIDREMEKGKDGYLFFKFNSLSDKDFILKLYEAAKAGVRVKLIIRGICCIKPGYRNMEIRSIVGRYLEHSRVYIFGRENPTVYISSADLMTRNTERRVEIAVPIDDDRVKKKLLRYMEIQWNDNKKARVHTEHGDYQKIENGKEPLASQDEMMRLAEKNKK